MLPGRSKEVAKHKAINMTPKMDHLDREQQNFDFFLGCPKSIAAWSRPTPSRARSCSAAVEFSGPARLRRNPLCEAAHAVLRRPDYRGYQWNYQWFFPALKCLSRSSLRLDRLLAAVGHYVLGDVHDFNGAPLAAVRAYRRSREPGSDTLGTMAGDGADVRNNG